MSLYLFFTKLMMREQKFEMEIKQEQIIPAKSIFSEHIDPPPASNQPFPLVKVEAGPTNHHLFLQGCQDDQEKLPKTTRRASYSESTHCLPVMLICRVLEPLHQQKSSRLSTKKQSSKSRPCNQTKNIAKNYGKAIIAYISNNRNLFRKICKACSTPYQRVIEELPELKSALSTVTGFRKVWTQYRYASCIRRVSHHFLRRVSLSYIFNSKIDNHHSHIKYRTKFLESLSDPQNFDHLKDY